MRVLLMSILTFTQSMLCADFSEAPQVEIQEEIKVYVKSNELSLSDDGIYWNFGEEQIPIQSIQAANGGLLATVARDEVKYVHYVCPGCGVLYCWYENCKTPGCPYNPRSPK